MLIFVLTLIINNNMKSFQLIPLKLFVEINLNIEIIK